MKVDVVDLYQKDLIGKEVLLQGWIRNHRKQKEFGFINFHDGTFFKPVQLIYRNDNENFEKIQKLRIGSAVEIEGVVIVSEGKGQEFEVEIKNFKLKGDCPEDYPIQPKRHSREFMREVAHLRPRTNLYQAAFRVRSVAAMAIHKYFQERRYVYVHTPIITGNDGEGAGEMFKVTTLDIENSKVHDFSKDFFGKKANLTVTGQLHAEAFALAYKRVYTFGPTFRAEKSHTKIHASEFWMIEPEVAFCDLDEIMDIEEDMLKFIVKYILKEAKVEIEFLDKFVEKGLLEKLEKLVTSNSVRIKYKEAINILLTSREKFEIQPKMGDDLATEHEKYLTEKHFKSPVFVYDWPKDIKAFYMRLNEDDTVAAVDLLVPGAGELIGGSQREERIDVLKKRMAEMNIDKEELEWYLRLRNYGGCVHSGYGMGFERFLIYVTGIENIRDVIPFPRTPGNCEF